MSQEVTVLFDFKDPYSYLALEPFLGLTEQRGVSGRWYPFLISAMRAPAIPGPDADRGVRHRWQRARYQAQDLQRYALARQLPARHFNDAGLYRSLHGELAAMGFNWALGEGGSVARDYLQTVFRDCWDGDLPLDSLTGIERTLAQCGAETDGFDLYCQGSGLEELAAQRETLVEAGAFAAPAILIDGEGYLGRAHLPRLRAELDRLAVVADVDSDR